MPDDPMRQCGAVRRESTDVLRCGRPAVHVEQGTDHGDWRKIGEVDPTGGPWVGRVLDALWGRVADNAPDAWRAPDDAGRSVRPETPGAIPPGVEVTPLGSRSREGDMASIAEVQAAAGAISGRLEETVAQLDGSRNVIAAEVQAASFLTENSSNEAGQAAIWRMRSAEMGVNDAIANLRVAMDQLSTFQGGI